MNYKKELNNEYLRVSGLSAIVNNTVVLNRIDLSICACQSHVLMGANGSGKSSLAHAIMGHPRYKVTEGLMWWKNQDVPGLSIDERARTGIFLAVQHPGYYPWVIGL